MISFVVVVGFWLANHQVLASFQALDGATVRVCIYLVGLVIFIPFATKAISDPDPANHPLPTARCMPATSRRSRWSQWRSSWSAGHAVWPTGSRRCRD